MDRTVGGERQRQRPRPRVPPHLRPQAARERRQPDEPWLVGRRAGCRGDADLRAPARLQAPVRRDGDLVGEGGDQDRRPDHLPIPDDGGRD